MGKRTTAQSWDYSFFLLASEQTVLDTGATASTVYTYQSPATAAWLPQIIEKDEYDYGGGQPIRKTITNYQSFSGTPGLIANMPCQTIVYDGNNNRASQTDYLYDGRTSVCATVVSAAATAAVNGLPPGSHDDTTFAAGSPTPRGNLTTITQQCFPNCTNAITSYSYDKTGQVTAKVDPNGNAPGGNPSLFTTNYYYSDSFASGTGTPPGNTNAYLTHITFPSNNGVIQQEYFTYGYTDGQLRILQDQNSRQTTYSYNDPLLRPKQINFPDGGQTAIEYIDSGPNPYVTQTKLVSPAPLVNVVTKSVTDGLGHVTQTQLLSDPEGITKTDITYDGLGRVQCMSNPYRTISNGSICNTYDSLGRVTLVTKQDNGTVTTSYLGNTTTVTDEALKKRKTQTNALGFLTAVWEDPTGLNYETDYQYDVLGNLLRVDQKGTAPGNSSQWRTRTFAYDSLSRLLCAGNPEIAIATCPNPDNGSYMIGTLRYAYDANGNLLTKTSPKPNQPGPITVQTTYSYDYLNRLTQKSYNDSFTPTVKFGYDGTGLVGCSTMPPIPSPPEQNAKGNRTSMCDGAGATSWTHDNLGRIIMEDRITTGQRKTYLYSFNLDGSPKTIQRTLPPMTITYTPGGAGRPLGAMDIPNNVNYVSLAQYAPFGGLTSMVNGSPGQTITTNNSYNSRLQPATIFASTLSQIVLNLVYDFHLNNQDNGNVFQILNLRDPNRTQNFSYDSLNRISTAYTNGPNWGETFTTDAWGNLTNRGPYAGKTNYESLNAAPATSQNRLPGLFYDAAGNVTQNGSATYSYDAENRLVNSGGVTYNYDGDGNRVYKSTGTLYWGAGPLAESDLSGNITADYIFFNGKRVARRDASSQVSYYFSDHLGSASVVTNSAGVITDESDYYPYGGEIPVVNTDPNHYKFTGKERDTETGLDYFGARYGASNMGRFMTPDWAPGRPSAVPFAEWSDPQTLNLYSYARNNPLAKADPDGHDPGDKFKTKAAAATDAVKYMRKQENGYKWEYGTRIHQDGKSFSYGPVVTQDKPKGVDPPPLQKNDVGVVHTHNYGVGEDSHANNIEQPDRVNAIQEKQQVEQMQGTPGTTVNYQSYVGAPNGDVIQFTPNSNAPDNLGNAKVVQKNVAPAPNPPQPPPPNCKQAGNCQR